MSLAIIELNDSEVRVATDTDIIVRSPGCAIVDKDTLVLGEPAVQQSRLKPRAAFDRFWDNLNQDPLKYSTVQVRHHADLAYAHLLAIHEMAGKPDEIIFAVPAKYNNDQLALLLGLAAAAPFNAAGLVDTAIAAAAATVGKGEFMHADIHLHNTVLTHIIVSDRVTRQSVQVIEGAGLAAIMDTCAYAIADLFIKQSRFDPQQLPETEQALYNQIPACLETLMTRQEVQLEITYQQIQHQVKINPAILEDALQNQYRRITDAIPAATDCLISDRLDLLPGFRDRILCAGILNANSVFRGCQANLSHIRAIDETPALNFITDLPAAAKPLIHATVNTARCSSTTADQVQHVTHVLYENHAWPLGKHQIYLSASGGAPSVKANGAECSLRTLNGRMMLTPEHSADVFLNGRQAARAQQIEPGDKLTFAGSGTEYTFIWVKG
jgi:hypothetical protein